ncbi:MAG: cell division protein SepF [Clostridia bacterium]|nr:cell division protein SepF [Clostridia bacterium]
MEFVDKLKDYFNGGEPEYEEDENFESESSGVEEFSSVRKKRDKAQDKKKSRESEQNGAQSSRSYRSREQDYSAPQFEKQYSSYRSTPNHSSKVVDIHTTAKLQVVLTKPEKFFDAKEIADNLNEKRTVVLNLESTNKDEALRLLDFLSGVAYANDGEIKKIAKSTFIITPYNVDVMGDLLYELESNGVFFV